MHNRFSTLTSFFFQNQNQHSHFQFEINPKNCKKNYGTKIVPQFNSTVKIFPRDFKRFDGKITGVGDFDDRDYNHEQ